MSLKDTEEKLYKPGSDLENREHGQSVYDLNEANLKGGGGFVAQKADWDKSQTNWLDANKRKAIIIGAIVLGSVMILSMLFILMNKLGILAFSKDKVLFSIEGADLVKSSEDVEYTIKYKNKNMVFLNDAEIEFNHSENFYPNQDDNIIEVDNRISKIDIGRVYPFGSGEIKISGKFYGSENYMVYLQPTMKYQTSKTSGTQEVSAQLGVKITDSPIKLELSAPKEALSDSTIEYVISYENDGSGDFDGLEIRLEYPEGFYFQSGSVSPSQGNNIWSIGNLTSGSGGTLKIEGRVEGAQYDIKPLKVTLYKSGGESTEIVYAKAESVTKVVTSPLLIIHKLNGKTSANVNLGDKLDYEINYANHGEIGFKDVIIKLKLDSPAIDYENIDLRSGFYSSQTKDIMWKAADIPGLQKLNPGDSGKIELTIPLKNRIDINSKDDKNFVIESVATIDSSDIDYRSLGESKSISSTVIGKLNSKVIFENEIFYNDDDIRNSGPIPQKVGEETTYTVVWKVSNVSNDLSNVKVSAFLPTWVQWKDKTSPQGEDIKFNERTHEVIWNIGKVENAKGILNDPKTVKFQIGFEPEVNQAGKIVDLLYEASISGDDDFTNNRFDIKTDNRTTSLKEFENSEITSIIITN